MAGGGRRAPLPAELARESAELAAAGVTAGLVELDEGAIDLIFATVAQECKTLAERKFFLARCKAEGLSPIKGEIYAVRYDGILQFPVSWHVFMSRMRRVGWLITAAEAVCEGDIWQGWDAVERRPVKHIIHALQGERGNILGAWARAESERDPNIACGGWWTARELLKTAKSDKNPWRWMPEHMSKKTAATRVGRIVVPDLASLYVLEEFGYESPEPGDEPEPPHVIDMTPPQTPPEAPPTAEGEPPEGESSGDGG